MINSIVVSTGVSHPSTTPYQDRAMVEEISASPDSTKMRRAGVATPVLCGSWQFQCLEGQQAGASLQLSCVPFRHGTCASLGSALLQVPWSCDLHAAHQRQQHAARRSRSHHNAAPLLLAPGLVLLLCVCCLAGLKLPHLQHYTLDSQQHCGGASRVFLTPMPHALQHKDDHTNERSSSGTVV